MTTIFVLIGTFLLSTFALLGPGRDRRAAVIRDVQAAR